jgi:hypothetical protein
VSSLLYRSIVANLCEWIEGLFLADPGPTLVRRWGRRSSIRIRQKSTRPLTRRAVNGWL